MFSSSFDGPGCSKAQPEFRRPDDKDKVTIKKRYADGQGSCYCGKGRNLNIAELLCATCNQWFHSSCVSYQLGKLVPFMTNYAFVCKNCSDTGLETYSKNQAPFAQMCLTAIANLRQGSIKDGSNKTMFSKDTDIIPYIHMYWDSMTTMPRRMTQSWYGTVLRAMMKETQVLFTHEHDAVRGPMFGLYNMELTSIKPNYEAMALQGQLPDMKGPAKRQSRRRSATSDPIDSGASSNKKPPVHGYPADHPFNKEGYRYTLAEPDPNAPSRQEFDECSEWSGKPIPGWLYRAHCASSVALALHDRAPQLKVSDNKLAVTGDRGYCMIRASHGVSRGGWYFEVTVEAMPNGAATRLGWGQRYANLQTPLGYDKFGYSWRSRKGTKFHESRGKHYSDGYGEGDTLGFLIVLPDSESTSLTPNPYKDRPLVKFKTHLYFEEKDNIQESVNNLKLLPGSKIIFFKNGVSQGDAFTDIYQGCYYPSISLHKNSKVKANFGPVFQYPPITELNYRPISEKAEEAICEQSMADMLYLTENEGKLRLDNINAEHQ